MMKRILVKLASAWIASIAAYYLVQVTFAITIGGTGQLSDIRYMLILSGIAAVLCTVGVLVKRPFLLGAIVGAVLFIGAQVLRWTSYTPTLITLYSDLLFDFGFTLLPPSLLLSYQHASNVIVPRSSATE